MKYHKLFFVKCYKFIFLSCLLAIFSSALNISPCYAEFFNGDKLVDRYQAAIVFSRIVFFTGQVPEGLSTRELPFSDVPSAYKRPVATVTSLGLMSALEDEFNGKDFITRYDLALAVKNLCKVTTVAHGEANRHLVPKDVDVFSRHRESAIFNSTNRLLKVSSGKFNGSYYISRYEFASICAALARHFSLKPYVDVKLNLEDIPSNHWALEDIRYACSTGILNTRGVGKLPVNSETPSGKTEHISRFHRRRDSAHGNFPSEFSHGAFK